MFLIKLFEMKYRYCFICLDKNNSIKINHFFKQCGFKKCHSIGSHEHYICDTCREFKRECNNYVFKFICLFV